MRVPVQSNKRILKSVIYICSSRNSHSLLVGMQNGADTLGDSLVVSDKTTHTLTMQPSNYAPRYLPRGVKNVYPHKTLHTDVYNCFIHYCQDLEMIKMSFSE